MIKCHSVQCEAVGKRDHRNSLWKGRTSSVMCAVYGLYPRDDGRERKERRIGKCRPLCDVRPQYAQKILSAQAARTYELGPRGTDLE